MRNVECGMGELFQFLHLRFSQLEFARRIPHSALTMLGRTIGNYEVVSRFGEGGMGELYLGRHTRLAREVIIKTIRAEEFSSRQIEHLRVRLEREAYIQSQLDNSHIVRV